MAHLIDKAALVAEIERLKECNHLICGGDFDFLKKAYPEHYYSTEAYNDILSFINTLEVKKDLELTVDDVKKIDRLLNRCVDCSNPYQEVLNRFNKQKGE